MPMKIASMKKEKPSIAKPRPKTLPKLAGEGGPEESHLETEDRARYDPGANRAAITFVQRFASVR
jgi:hypothetical protein